MRWLVRRKPSIILVVSAQILISLCLGLPVIRMPSSCRRGVIRISECVWRQAAEQHQTRIRELLLPGLLPTTLGSNQRPKRRKQHDYPAWTALDPNHPVYNFFIEYYGLKGTKGPRRLARWSPDFSSLVVSADKDGRASSQNDFDSRGGGIILEGASERDLGGVLHLRGASFVEDGILYSPSKFFAATLSDDSGSSRIAAAILSPYLWYRDVLERTLRSEPVLHCYGLHEWAMQYQPPGAIPPPSAQYQSHLPLRCSRQAINAVVERKKGALCCTHYDALRFFAPAAGPLNVYGSYQTLGRRNQLELEQPACVHAQMDLLKMALRLQPFCSSDLLQRILKVALDARRLDVAASPFDASSYGVEVVPVETQAGRLLYCKQQIELMNQAESVRTELLKAYDVFLHLAFRKQDIDAAKGLTFDNSHPQPAQNCEY